MRPRRIVSLLVAGCMMVSMVPASALTAFAETTADTSVSESAGITTYQQLVDAIKNAAAGSTVTVDADINVEDTLIVTKQLTLDLNGHKLYNTKDIWQGNDWSMISVRESGDLTITGNGELATKANDCFAVDVYDTNAKLTIENGKFVGNITAVYVYEGEATINGGSFSIQQLNDNKVQDEYGLTINCYDSSYKSGIAKVTITGGTFYKFDPAENRAEGAGTNFCSAGYVSEKDGDEYTVKTTPYQRLVDAIADAPAGGTVTVSEDVDVKKTLVIDKPLTLNLNGHKLYNSKDIYIEDVNDWSLISVRKGESTLGDLTITGDGTLDAKENDCYAFDVQDEGVKLTIENGTFIGNVTTVYNYAGEVTINGGSFSIKQLNNNKVQDEHGLTINCYDSSYKSGIAKVTITGGTFDHFDPAANRAEGNGTNFCARGYITEQNGDAYTVKKRTYDNVKTDVKPEESGSTGSGSTGGTTDTPQQGEKNEPITIEVTTTGAKEDLANIKTLSLDFGDALKFVTKVEIKKGDKTFDLSGYKDQNYQNMEIPGLFDDLKTSTDAEENGIALLAADNATLNFDLNVTYSEEGEHTVNVVFKDEDDITVSEDSTTVQVGPVAHSITVVNGTADKASAKKGEQVKVTADAPETGKKFTGWTAEGVDLTDDQKKQSELTITMPDNDITLTANYEDEEPEPVKPVEYTVTVVNGTADKASAKKGEQVKVTADAPETGKKFTGWTAEGVDLTDDQKKQSELTITMPKNDITLTANYEDESTEPVEPVEPEQPAAVDDGTGAVITAVIGGAAIGAVGYAVGTELWLKDNLPNGVIPTNREALALLLWNAAGKPQPVSNALYTDLSAEAADSQMAARWCAEQGLMKDYGDSFKPGEYTFRLQVIKAWKQVQDLIGQ